MSSPPMRRSLHDLSKALEYGEWPKLVLVLRQSAMRRLFRIVEATAATAEIEAAQSEYPTVVRMQMNLYGAAD